MPLSILHFPDCVWLDPRPSPGERTVRRGDLQYADLGGAQERCRVRSKPTFDAGSLRLIDHTTQSDLLANRDSSSIKRPLKRFAQPNFAIVETVEVPRHPSPILHIRRKRTIFHDSSGRKRFAPIDASGFKSRQIDEWLEERAWLSFGLDGAVKLAAVIVPPSHHRLDGPRFYVQRYQCALRVPWRPLSPTVKLR